MQANIMTNGKQQEEAKIELGGENQGQAEKPVGELTAEVRAVEMARGEARG